MKSRFFLYGAIHGVRHGIRHGALRASLSLLLLLCAPVVCAEILFNAKVLGPVANLYTVDESSGNLRKVTDNIRWRDLAADVNSRGAIIFSSNREPDARIDLQRHSENFNLYLSEPGQPPRALVSGPGQEMIPRFSPSSDLVAYLERSADGDRLMLATGDGGEELLKADKIFDFSWAPAGGDLAVAMHLGGSSGVWRVSVKGDKTRLISSGKSEQVVSAQWSPDGKHIAFVRHPLDGPGRALWVVDAKEGHEKKISAEGREVQDSISWSADGSRLLYAALVDYQFFYDEEKNKKVYRGAAHIFESDLSDTTRQLSRGKGLRRAPVYSPDEAHIAYLYADRLDARSLALRVSDRDGKGDRQLFDSVAQRSSLKWF